MKRGAKGRGLHLAFRNTKWGGGTETGSPKQTWLDRGLGFIGLPSLSGSDDDESTYDKAQQMQNGLGGNGLSNGERYRRNPDGSYGSQTSSRWDIHGMDAADRLLDMALSAGNGWFASWAEGFLSGYGKARFSFRINEEGEVTGAGDFLLPLYDSEATTVFTQLGLRTMTDERVIGNWGLGQRFFPAPNFTFGYNVFLDQDFSREHTRGGAGLEARYDWLRLSANYYTPLSSWKGSKDYDSRLVEERPARGYDARVTGYLPFYRHLAVTGAFEQWKGDRVGTFGGGGDLQRDPKVWSYGLEWTPIPAISTSVTQRHSGGQKDTQFALSFNYMFDMPWEDQLSAGTVAEMRTVDGSRHDFVDRQSEMILQYQAKDAYNIIYVSKVASNTFQFRLVDGFDQVKGGKAVRVEAEYAAFVGGDTTTRLTTDRNGEFIVFLETVTASPVFLTITAGETTKRFSVDADITKPVVVVPPPAPPVVVPDSYSMEADPDTLIQNKATDVIFTFMLGNTPVEANTPVVFKNYITFTGLPTNATTDASGQVKVTGLTTRLRNEHVVKAEINGEPVEFTFKVIVPDTYTLEADPDELVQKVPTDVTFTFKMNNIAVDAGTPVTFITDDPTFPNLPAGEQQTDADGKVKVTGLTATSTGRRAVQATINSQTASAIIDVLEPEPYSMEADIKTLVQGAAADVTFTFTQGGTTVAENTPVTFTTPNSAFPNLPADEQKTDAGGKVKVEGLRGAAIGEQKVEAKIDGQTMEETITVTPAPKGLLFTAKGENENFNDPNKGYQSTIEVTVEYNDGSGSGFKPLPAGSSVKWDMKSVDNPDEKWWLKSNTSRSGLTWGDTADGTKLWENDFGIESGSPPTDGVGVAKITDVVGSRSVTLTAEVCVGASGTSFSSCSGNGGKYWGTGEKTVRFGAGPLSVFTTAPVSGIQWATGSGVKDESVFNSSGASLDTTEQPFSDEYPGLADDFFAGNADFPAIGHTEGTPPNRVGFTFTFTTSWQAAFPSGWTSTGMWTGSGGVLYPAYYAEGSGLPKESQLLAVARYNNSVHPDIPRKGAAFAAGWPSEPPPYYKFYSYWTGEVMFLPPGIFYAKGVHLSTGRSSTAYALIYLLNGVVGVK